MKTEQKDGARHLSMIVGISEKTHSSSNVEHDSMNVIHRYIPNSSTNEAIERFTAGLAFGGSAISITGPYGSGKSTFGVMLSHLAAPKDDEGFGHALGRIGEVYENAAHDMMESRAMAGIHKTGMIRCIVTARPEPVATTILRAIINGVESYFGADYDNLDFTYAGTLRRLSKTAKVPDSGSIIDVITSLAAVSPILLMIDEFGKNIEYFADEGIDGDLFLLQELTEMSGASRKIPLHIITMQHMAFGEYVAGTLAGRMREWGKIQGRFEDVHFSNSLEHTRAVLASSLKPADGSMHRIMEWAGRQSESAANDAGVNIGADLVASCYPLHPLAVEALPELCSRYGQNERTLLSFVSGGGPATVSRFIDKTMCNDDSDLPTIGIDALYDYFISGSGSTRAGGATSSRVVEIDTIIRDIQGLDGTRLRTLKAIGILNLIGRSGRLRASVGMLRCVVGHGVEQDVAYLESRSVITYRQHADEYRIWHGTDVNIAAKLDAWRKAKNDMPFHDIMRSAISPAPVVAARHGIETGTIRIFQCIFGVDNMVIENDYDGAIVYGNKDTCIREYHKPVMVSRCEDETPLKIAAVEVSALRSVLQDDDVSSDHVARSETSERLAAAEAALLTEFGRAYGSDTIWLYKKDGREHPMHGTAGSAASDACSKWYDSTPMIRNEMINRNDLTAQGATARNRLMAAIIEKWGSVDPWFDSWSPERAVYDTMIRENGMHVRPKPTTKSTLHKPWNRALKAMQKTKQAIELEDLYDIWKECPLGMKNGTMPILALLIIMSKRKSIAVYEHGTYVHRLSAGLAERLAKNPKHFRLKWFKKTKSRDELVTETASKLGLGSNAKMLDIVSHLVGVVRMLPTYTRRTKRLGKETLAVRGTVQDAIEPDTLLFESIPRALGMRSLDDNISKNRASHFAGKLSECVDELQGAYDSTLDNMADVLFSETGTVDRLGVSKAASELLPLVSDHAMKVFLGAVSAEIPNEKSWKEYVGLTLTDKPPADWNDDDVDMFRNRLVEISAGFKRLAALRFSVVAGSLAKPSVMVTITHPDGREERIVLPVDDRRVTGLSKGSDK